VPALVRYSLLLSGKQLNDYDHQYLVSTIRTVSDLERIADHFINVAKTIRDLIPNAQYNK